VQIEEVLAVKGALDVHASLPVAFPVVEEEMLAVDVPLPLILGTEGQVAVCE
jgi:hypothetical protein